MQRSQEGRHLCQTPSPSSCGTMSMFLSSFFGVLAAIDGIIYKFVTGQRNYWFLRLLLGTYWCWFLLVCWLIPLLIDSALLVYICINSEFLVWCATTSSSCSSVFSLHGCGKLDGMVTLTWFINGLTMAFFASLNCCSCIRVAIEEDGGDASLTFSFCFFNPILVINFISCHVFNGCVQEWSVGFVYTQEFLMK